MQSSLMQRQKMNLTLRLSLPLMAIRALQLGPWALAVSPLLDVLKATPFRFACIGKQLYG